MIERLKLMLKEKELQLHSPIRPKKTRTIGLVQDNSAKDLLRKKKITANNSSINSQMPINDSEVRVEIE